MQLRSIGIISASHLCIDITQGALPALLPYLILSRHLSYASAGGLIFAASIASSIVQPVFGYYSDRLSKAWLMPVGMALAAICMSLIGIVPAYWAMILVVAVCGLGVAAFHPEGARQVNLLSGKNKATAMSLFSMGGNTGFAVGPLIVTLILWVGGLHGTLLLAVPILLMAIILSTQLSRFTLSREEDTSQAVKAVPAPQRDAWGAFAALSMAVVFRSIIFYGLIAFIPLYWVAVLHQSKAMGGSALTLFTVCGIIGTFIGGRLADRFGYLNLIRVGFALLIPLLFVFVHITHVVLATAMLIPIGIIYYAPFSAMVVLGQQYLPNRVGLASGVTLGLAVSIGGATTPILGRLADLRGIPFALTCVAFLPIVVLLTAFFLRTPQPVVETKVEVSVEPASTV